MLLQKNCVPNLFYILTGAACNTKLEEKMQKKLIMLSLKLLNVVGEDKIKSKLDSDVLPQLQQFTIKF